MLAMTTTRIAELSRPDYVRDLREYAGLEFPREDLYFLNQVAVAAARESAAAPRRRFRFFGPCRKATEGAAAKA